MLKIRKSNKYYSLIAAILFSIILLAVGAVLIIAGATNTKLVTTTEWVSGSGMETVYKEESEPLYNLIFGGIGVLLCIPFVWLVLKPIVDGFAIIVAAHANQLEKDGTAEIIVKK